MSRDLPFDPDAVSREPSDYHQTQHFRLKMKYRKLPSPTPSIAAETIREGDLRRANHDHQVCFEYDYGTHVWRVIAELTDTPPHPLVTIYAVNAHGPGEHGGIPEVGE